MSGRPVIHDTFSIQRHYLAIPSRVFAAFASAEARDSWGDPDAVGTQAVHTTQHEMDFRVGGQERFAFKWQGNDTIYRYDAHYYDIVLDQRIIYAYEMYANDARISVSVATIEFAKDGDGTTLVWTEQGTYLDGIDGAAAPRLREQGTAEMLDELTGYLKNPAAH